MERLYRHLFRDRHVVEFASGLHRERLVYIKDGLPVGPSFLAKKFRPDLVDFGARSAADMPSGVAPMVGMYRVLA